MITPTQCRAALAMADSTQLALMRQMLLDLDADVVFEARDGLTTLAHVQDCVIDVLLMDLVLPALDAPALIREIHKSAIPTMPAVILTLPTPMPEFERRALDVSAYAVLERPTDPDRLALLLMDLHPSDRLQRRGAGTQAVQDALSTLGFSVRHRGTSYLSYAIWLTCKDNRLLKQLKGGLYTMVAERFQVSVDKVEHGIRRAVESAWSSGALEAQHRAFGNTIDARRGKPTSGEMIARVAELLRMKEIKQ
ncbi:response regulator [Eubacteriales bacterium OttesenSCG-928-N13]|nr:response regulator [Eubacteriales bacterium OttesenSCG-928-N13]